MRVLIVQDFAQGGGAEILVGGLVEGLRLRGLQTKLTVAETSSGSQSPLGLASRCCSLESWHRLRRIVTDFQPDVAILAMVLQRHSPTCLPALGHTPCVYWAQMYESICPVGTRQLPDGRPCEAKSGVPCLTNSCVSWKAWGPLMLQKWLWNRWNRGLDRYLATSRWLAGRLRSEGQPVDGVLYPGVPVPEGRSRSAAVPRIVCVSRLSKEKGVENLLSAFGNVSKKHPEVRLDIIGGGDCESRLRRMTAGMGLEQTVSFSGELPPAQVQDRVRGAWMQVVPSVWQEPFGLVAVEAQLLHIPVVAGDIGGLREIVKDEESGLLVPPGKPGALAAALERLLSDRALGERLAEKGAQSAREKFTLDHCLDRWVEMLRSLSARRDRPD